LSGVTVSECWSGVEREQLVDLREAIVWLPESVSVAERKAAEMLSSEIKRRTRVLLPISTRLLSRHPHIIICSLDKLPHLDIHIKQRLEAIESPEGFVVEVSSAQGGKTVDFRLWENTEGDPFCGWKVASDAENETRLFGC
jgi:hypothetical protein